MNIEELRKFCLSLPAVTEDIKWENDLCFLVGGKMFCVTGLQGNSGISIKAGEDEYEELIEREHFIPAPYLARAKWVYIQTTSKLSEKELKRLIRQSYELIKSKLPRKLQNDLGL